MVSKLITTFISKVDGFEILFDFFTNDFIYSL